MQIAYYAPMKSPDHPVPSGDRTIARGLRHALEYSGHHVTLASDLRIYDGLGKTEIQEALFADAAREVERILQTPDSRNWAAWITYHSFYKAPDLIGPAVCKALDLPYLLIEATRAKKRLTGPWARFSQAAESACDHARTIFYFTERDAEALLRDAPEGQEIVHLAPFLQRTDLPEEAARTGPILVVGMMRPGDKLASYALVSEAFQKVTHGDWHCEIVGDGPARPEVEALFARFGERVRFLGALDPADALAQYATASLFLWPGVNEAFGMVYLEAQAAGLPVVAQDRVGVRDVVHGPRAALTDGAQGLANRLDTLLESDAVRHAEGATNRAQIKHHHLLDIAAERLNRALELL